MGVSLQKKRIRLSEPKDAKRFTAHQASLIVIFFCSLPPNSLRYEHRDRGVMCCGPWLVRGSLEMEGGRRRVGQGRCWTSHAVRFADNTILSYLINVVPSIQCCVPAFSSGLRSAVRRRLTSGRTVVSVVRINSDIIGELTRQHCVHFYGSYAFRTSYR